MADQAVLKYLSIDTTFDLCYLSLDSTFKTMQNSSKKTMEVHAAFFYIWNLDLKVNMFA